MEHSDVFGEAEEDEDKNKLITLGVLADAIGNKMGIDLKDAKEDANTVLDFFGYDNRTIDNYLTPEERQVFYILQDEGMLETRKEENELYDGKTWRTHYWELNKKNIFSYSKGNGIERFPTEKKERNPYESLGEEIWKRKGELNGQIGKEKRP